LKLRRFDEDHAERIAQIERILGSITVVELPENPGPSVAFGARVTLQDAANETKTYHILGVDELDFDPDSLSWISPLGRALLAAELGDRITTAETGPVTIVKIEYPGGSR
jgi:transcription elongation factor GreA